MGKGRAVAIELNDVVRRELTALTRKHGAPQALAERARIVLAAAGGLKNKEIASKLGICTHRFYRALGFEVLHGDEESSFTSFRVGVSYLNLIAQPAERRWSWWGRVIFYVADVDALYGRALAAGYQPTTVPRDAEWGERYFHLVDPDGHEFSFARPLLS